MTKYKIRKNFLIAAILATGLISALIGVVAYFGLNMGTFVIGLDDLAYKAGLSLSVDPEFQSSTPRLLPKPCNNTWPITYADIDIEKAVSTNGDFIDERGLTYMAYTFYLRNEGNTTLDVLGSIDLTEVTKDLDSACRVMLIEESRKTIYYKDDGTDLNPLELTPRDEMQTFKSSSVIGETTIKDFRPGEVLKYTIFIWLEGWDVECENDKMGGQIKMDMRFSIVRSIHEDEK